MAVRRVPYVWGSAGRSLELIREALGENVDATDKEIVQHVMEHQHDIDEDTILDMLPHIRRGHF